MSDDEPPDYPSISCELKSGTITVTLADGSESTLESAPSDYDGAIERVTLLPTKNRLKISVQDETFDLPLTPEANPSRTPIIYLDQNHWIDFAKYWRNVGALDEQKSKFFERLAAAITSGLVITPISSGHLVETTRRQGPSRLDVAATMLHFSKGWQMRSVLSLRRAESRQLFGGAPISRNEVLRFQRRGILVQHDSGPTTVPEQSAFNAAQDKLLWATTLVDLFLDGRPSEESREIASRWAIGFPSLSEELSKNTKARSRAREATLIRFLVDAQDDFAGAASESGLTAEDFGRWLTEGAENGVSQIPGLSRLREVLHERLMNSQDKWEANDLNDWLYLSYAAAYFDLVLGEKKTSAYLNRIARRVPEGALVTHSAARAGEMLSEILLSVK